MSDLNVSPSQLSRFITAAMQAAGLPLADAQTVG